MNINLNINNRNYKVDIEPGESLLEVMRRLKFYSLHQACGSSSCGLCTVLIDDLPKLSCSTLAIRCQNSKITSLEGLIEESQDLRTYMAKEGSDQCGYCSPGFIVNVISLKRQNRPVRDEEIREYLKGNLCRCTGYESQFRAVRKYLGE